MKTKPVCPPLTKPDPSLQTATLHQKVCYFVASTAWTGHLPASGTWGSLVAFFVHNTFFPHVFTLEYWPYNILIVLAVTLTGIYTGEIVERMTGVKDDSRITVDEVAGYCITVLFLPAGWIYTMPAFVFCRIFDILKPPPARQLQNIHGGIGVMIDDVIASVYACLLLNGFLYFY